ncbi:MAG: molybdopterin biosynthesis protein [Caldisericaceae bacterium]
MKKEIFLKRKSLAEAVNVFREKLRDLRIFKSLKEEEIPTYDSLGRITSREVYAKISEPFYNASAVDGFALISSSTSNATISNPKTFVIGKNAKYVNTGDILDFPFDCVAMVEDVKVDDNLVSVFNPLHYYENVRTIGEDFSKGEIIIPVYEKIRPEHVGILISSLNEKVFVFEKPKVLIIATGEEVKRINEPLQKGDVVDSNSYMVSSIVEAYGGEANVFDEVLPNDFKVLRDTIDNVKDVFHAIVIIGGSAKGTKDLIADVFESFGEILFHGITIQPGKPIVIGFNKDTPLIGLPGFPVSNYIDAKIFLKIFMEEITGVSLDYPSKAKGVVKRDIPSSLGVQEFVRVKISNVHDELIVVPLKRGASNISSVVNSDGLISIKDDLEGIPANSSIEVELLKSIDELNNQLLFIGSNDPMLEFLLNFAKKQNPQFKFGIVNTGSLGGLLSFLRGETFFTSIHLFDKETRTYNESYIKKYLKDKKILRILFALRNQGLIVKKGNPKKIYSINDLLRKDVVFVNRQKGSGTRIFLDYLLESNYIDPNNIKGYDVEEITHLGVANAVLSGLADCGLGIEYVANLFDLDFIKLGEEEYEILIDYEEKENSKIKYFLEVMHSEAFKKNVENFKGYIFKGEIRSF